VRRAVRVGGLTFALQETRRELHDDVEQHGLEEGAVLPP
jgi:hypothetical protein